MRVVSTAWWYTLPAFVLSFPAFFVTPYAAAGCVAIGAMVLYFFRDPERTSPLSGVVSPADGTVSIIRTENDRIRVGVFMNVTDVHVNRAPVPGVIQSVDHKPGGYRPAFSKESDRNERVRLVFDGADGLYEVYLIAGAIARRITPYVEPGDELERGERIGHIAFGSRVDVLLPAWVSRRDIRVTTGEKVRAGETIICHEGQGS